MTDTWEEMFRLQSDYQSDSFGRNFQRMTDADRVQFIKEMQQACVAELFEALDEVSWKSWATSRHINRDAYVGELVDVLHFWINMVLVLGGDPEHLAREVFRGYLAKRAVNIRRQMDGYDGVAEKCSVCGRALDDPAVMCKRTLDGGSLCFGELQR